MGLDDKISNAAKEGVGKAKEGLGDATDNESMEAQGHTDQAVANANQAGEHVKDAGNDVKEMAEMSHTDMVKRSGPLQAAVTLGADPCYERWPDPYGWWLTRRARAGVEGRAPTR